MRAVFFRRTRPIKFMILLLISILLFSIVWKFFINKNQAIAEDYQLLADISPELIISAMKIYPNDWKDYVAVTSAFQATGNNANSNSNQLDYRITKITNQLDHKVPFKKLDWSDINPDTKDLALHSRKILDKYRFYDPQQYTYPINEECYFIDTYGADREGGKRRHEGTDIFNKKGTPIVSVSSGKIEKLGWNRLGGERVGVRGDDGNYYYYAHLDTINEKLEIGKTIEKGELIGTMGNTGDAISTPDHLHFGIELPNEQWVNPYSFLKVWDYQKFGH